MTESLASASALRADVTPAHGLAQMRWGVRAAADGDWLIFLDVARNRYRAVGLTAAPPIAGVTALAPRACELASAWQALARDGLVTAPERNGVGAQAQRAKPTWRDVFELASAAFWARRIVRRGALLEAFATLTAAKSRIPSEAASVARARDAYARFAAARIWIPASYVCLFDSLCLMRVLLSEGICGDLVFGVRARPFAAHCWVECEGEILDDGGETCASFVEIVRV